MKFFNKYKFSDKKQTRGGIISTLLGIGALILLVAGVYMSFKASGDAGSIVGVLAIFACIMSIAGVVIGLISFKEDNRFYIFSKIGSLLCGIEAIFFVAVFMMGMGI